MTEDVAAEMRVIPLLPPNSNTICINTWEHDRVTKLMQRVSKHERGWMSVAPLPIDLIRLIRDDPGEG